MHKNRSAIGVVDRFLCRKKLLRYNLRQPGTANACGQRVGEQEHYLHLRQPGEYPVEEGVRLHDGYVGNGDQNGELRLREHGLEGPADQLQRAVDHLRYHRESVKLPGHDADVGERPAIGDADEERRHQQLQLRYQRKSYQKGCQWGHDGVLSK